MLTNGSTWCCIVASITTNRNKFEHLFQAKQYEEHSSGSNLKKKAGSGMPRPALVRPSSGYYNYSSNRMSIKPDSDNESGRTSPNVSIHYDSLLYTLNAPISLKKIRLQNTESVFLICIFEE